MDLNRPFQAYFKGMDSKKKKKASHGIRTKKNDAYNEREKKKKKDLKIASFITPRTKCKWMASSEDKSATVCRASAPNVAERDAAFDHKKPVAPREGKRSALISPLCKEKKKKNKK